ncbi:MAG: ribose transport system permease protein [Rhodospirillaceae bacterium]|jgi:ribose transport system permease protein|nr:ribose transport system permease protein [Rhodospirillaceae bacterium]
MTDGNAFSTDTGSTPPASPAGSRLHERRSLRWADIAVYFGFVLVFGFFALTLSDKGFLTVQNGTSIVSQVTPIALMAFGAVFVLTAGEIDLSIGSVVALAALFTALGLRHFGLPGGLAFGLLTGIGAGLLNGLLVVGLRVPSFLITLGTMQLYSGIAQLSTQLQDVPITNDTYNTMFGSGSFGPVSDAVVWLALGFIVAHIAYRNLAFGWRVMATGSNRASARALGINTGRVRVAVMVISSSTAALAGMIYAGEIQGAVYTLGSNDLLTVLAGVVIGGTSLFGGVGSIFGALLGALLMAIITNGLVLMGATVQEQIVINGIIIVIAVAISQRQPVE